MNHSIEYPLACFTSADQVKYPGLVRNGQHRTNFVFNSELAQFGIVSRPITELYSIDLSDL